jgi:O-methyltransferase
MKRGREFAGRDLSHVEFLKVSLDKVEDQFERFDLLDDQVEFLKGWFRDTLPGAPINRLAVLRLDGDLYESTIDSLNALYRKVSPGGRDSGRLLLVEILHTIRG